MGKPGKKLKKIILITGITGAVYGGFKYLLPLVIPFLLAYVTALWLRPSVRYFEQRFKGTVKGRTFHVPGSCIGALELLFILAAAFVGLFLGGKSLVSQIHLLTANLPLWLNKADLLLTNFCRRLESVVGLKDGYLVAQAGEWIEELGEAARSSTMPALMNHSATLFTWLTGGLIVLVIYFVAVILCIQEMDEIREKKSRSFFHREFSLLSRRLVNVGNAWLKAQIIIMMITAALTSLGFLLIKNPYFIVLGIVLGLLDALPAIGIGAVLIPWGLVYLLEKEWWKAAVLLGLYGVCYLVRQVLEARLMGSRMGLSSLETLLSMYVGLKLFGLAGFLLGPIGLLFIEDLTKLYGED